MYYTHHFAHRETLLLACDWLGRFGFETERRDGSPWLTLHVEPGQVHEVEMLVNAAEMTDPQGWPSFWDEVREDPYIPEARPDAGSSHADARRLAIHWHPLDDVGTDQVPGLDRICEAMGH